MKIAIFISDFPVFYWQWFNSFLNRLAEEGVEIDFFGFNQPKFPKYHSKINLIKHSYKNETEEKLVWQIIKEKAETENYKLCLGFELLGLAHAVFAAQFSNSLISYYSCELYDEENPNIYKGSISQLLSLVEQLIPSIDLFFIQDKFREDIFYKILKTENRPKKSVYFPISMPQRKYEVDKNFLINMFGLPKDAKILFYVGGIFEQRFINEIIQHSQNFDNNLYLIIHGHTRTAKHRIEEINRLNRNPNVIISINDYDDETIEKMTASADVGIVYYGKDSPNDFATGRSSSKLALYLQNSIPVICPDYPSFKKDLDQFNYGISINSFDEIKTAFQRIIENYDFYKKGAETAFNSVFNQDIYNRKLLEILNSSNETDINNIELLKKQLENRNWDNKYSLYKQYFSSLCIINKTSQPEISIIIISNKYSHEIIKNLEILSQERNYISFEIIFVNNGKQEEEFYEVKKHVNYFINLNEDTGAYIARNIAALFSSSAILVFLDDDALPKDGIIQSHYNLHKKYEIISVRGKCIPQTETALNKLALHYNLGDLPFPIYSDLEGNSSYKAEPFFEVGGWNDKINFGSGGVDLSIRLSRIYNDKRLQIYSPEPTIYHDYAKSEDHLSQKKKRQEISRKKLKEIYPEWDEYLLSWNAYYQKENKLIEKVEIEINYKPLISILIITYNRAEYLSEAIASVFLQNYDNYELIIVDDGSTDDTEKLVKSFNNIKINYYKKLHEGAPVARNYAVSKSKGDFILWLDDDDKLHEKALEIYVKYINKYSDASIFYCNLKTFGEVANSIIFYAEDWYNKNIELKSFLLKGCPIPNTCTLIKKTVFDEFSYNTNFKRAHDYELWSRLFSENNSIRIKYVPELICFYRMHSNNLTGNLNEKTDYSYELQILDNLLNELSLEELFPQFDWNNLEKSTAEAFKEIGLRFLELNAPNKTLEFFTASYKLNKSDDVWNGLIKLAEFFNISQEEIINLTKN